MAKLITPDDLNRRRAQVVNEMCRDVDYLSKKGVDPRSVPGTLMGMYRKKMAEMQAKAAEAARKLDT
jgi:hypothetical protein